MTLDETVVTRLNTAVAALTKDANLFAGPERAVGAGVPATCVFCLATGGPEPTPIMGPGAKAFHRGRVAVIIRGEADGAVDSFKSGQALARLVNDALRLPTISGIIRCHVGSSEPTYLGQGGEGHHRWAVSAELWYNA
jgi:hypothetical protein